MSYHAKADECLAQVGQRLKLLREEQGLSKIDLAEMAGLCDETIRRVEAGVSCTLATLASLLLALDAEFADLDGGDQ